MATMDNFFVMIKFFAFAIFLLVAFISWNAFTTSEMNEQLWEQTSVGTKVKADAQRAYDNWDWISVLVYFGIHLGVIALAFLLRSHPVVYIAGIILIVILVMVAAPISNAWEDITTNDLSSAVTNISKVDYIMLNLPTFEMIWGFITLIALAGFAKSEGIF